MKAVTVDADGHVLEPATLWEDYLEPEYRDRAIRIKKDEENLEYLEIDGKKSISSQGGGFGAFASNGSAETLKRFSGPEKITWEEAMPPGGGDPHERIKVMDQDGIDIAFLYPSLGISWEQECEDSKLTAACCRAYNNWMIDFCKPYPDRLKSIAHISLIDIDEAAKEARRVAKLGVTGVFLFSRPPWHHGRSFGSPENDPYWAELQDLGLAVGIHVVVGPEFMGSTMFPDGRNEPGAWHDIVLSLDVQVAFTSFVMEGILERFPRLKVLILETGAGWLPAWLERLDHEYKIQMHKHRHLTLSPTEYFQRQCWISMDPDDHMAPWIASELGADKILWASDYPHLDAYPDPVNQLKDNIKKLSEEDQRKILGENALKIYNVAH